MFINTLLLLGAVQALFLALVLAFNDKKNLANKWLIAWLLFIGLHLVFTYFGFAGMYKKFPLLLILGSAMMLLQGPFLFIYTAISTNRIQKLCGQHLLHALPYLFYTIYIAFVMVPTKASERYERISNLINEETNFAILSLGILNHIHIIIYLVVSIFLLRKHSKGLTATFSYLEGVNLKWLKNLLIGITAVAIIILIGLVASDLFPIISHYVKATLIFSALAVLPYYISFYAIRQKLIYPLHLDSSSEKYEASKLTKKESSTIAKVLTDHMKSSKPYLNPVLTIRDLSEDLNLHPKDLSRVINENFDKNFFNFINAFRVAEFKKRLEDPKNQNYTLIAIAYDCGFNTKSSFNSIFKKTTGLTPSAYRANL